MRGQDAMVSRGRLPTIIAAVFLAALASAEEPTDTATSPSYLTAMEPALAGQQELYTSLTSKQHELQGGDLEFKIFSSVHGQEDHELAKAETTQVFRTVNSEARTVRSAIESVEERISKVQYVTVINNSDHPILLDGYIQVRDIVDPVADNTPQGYKKVDEYRMHDVYVGPHTSVNY